MKKETKNETKKANTKTNDKALKYAEQQMLENLEWLNKNQIGKRRGRPVW